MSKLHADLDARATSSTDRTAALAAVVIFGVISSALNVASNGFLEADGITHYLFARWALADPQLLVNVWGRPLVTLLHALPAQLPGRLGEQPLALVAVRAVSMLLALAAAVMAWRVAVGQADPKGSDSVEDPASPSSEAMAAAHPALAAVFLLCMPMVILHSVSELTELPFGFLMVCALWAYQRRAWLALAILAGLLPAARPEGFGFAALAMLGLLLHRRWLAAAVVLLPLVFWDRLGWALHQQAWGQWWQIIAVRDDTPLFLPWLFDNWPYSSQSTYAPGPLWKLGWMLPAVVGPMTVPFVIAGIVVSLRQSPREHHGRTSWLIAGMPLVVLVVHSLLHWLGKMSSSGDVRYLVSVAPLWALLAWRGWEFFSVRLRWRRDYAWAALAGVVPLIAMHLHYPVVPLGPDVPAQEAAQVARWYQQSGWSRTHPKLATDHPLIWYTLDVSIRDHGGGKERIATAAPGTTFLWHEVYSMYNADERFVVPPEFAIQHGWSDVTPQEFPHGWRVFVTAPTATEAE